MPLECSDLPAVLCVPQLGRVIGTARQEHRSVGRVGHRIDPGRVAEQGQEFFPRVGIPEFRRPVGTPRQHKPPIGRERYGVNGVVVTGVG